MYSRCGFGHVMLTYHRGKETVPNAIFIDDKMGLQYSAFDE